MKGDTKNMNQTGKKRATSADKMINVIIAVVILAFLAAGIYAVHGVISENMQKKAQEELNMAIQNGEVEPTVEYLANQSGMSVEDYLAQYGLTVNDTLTKDSTQTELLNSMTLESYVNFIGSEQTADELIQQAHLEDEVTKDTLYSEYQEKLNASPLSKLYGDESTVNQIKEELTSMGIDASSVSNDMTYGDFNKLLEENQLALQEAAAAQAESEANAENAETAPSDADANTEAPSTEAAAE